MKAIKIDVTTGEVLPVEISGKLDSLYEQINCTCITSASRLHNNDVLFVDDESLLKPFDKQPGGFVFAGYPNYVLFGNGLIVGHDEAGEAEDVRSPLNSIKSSVRFVTDPAELKAAYDKQSNQGFQIITW